MKQAQPLKPKVENASAEVRVWCESCCIRIAPNEERTIVRGKPYHARYLSTEQYDRVLTEAEKIRWYLRPMIVLAVHTGVRRGNLLSHRRDHIDFVTNNIRLTDSTKNGAHSPFHSTKRRSKP